MTILSVKKIDGRRPSDYCRKMDYKIITMVVDHRIIYNVISTKFPLGTIVVFPETVRLHG
jgi:hypothetical protein